MGRKPRIEYYGAIYHIIQRGNNRLPILKKDGDKIYLLELFSEAKEIYDFMIYAYVIMNNHFHFLLQTLNVPISKIMHHIDTKYAKYYNRKTKSTGPVFEDRYTGILVQDESYFLTLIKYIHNNPVKANICRTMMDYKWTSDAFYRMNIGNMVDIDLFLNMLSSRRNKALRIYADLMDEPGDEEEDLKSLYKKNDSIGSKWFTDGIMAKDKKQRMALDKILDKTCPTGIEYNLIKDGSRKRYLSKYKKEYIKLGLKEGYSQKEIAKNIGISASAVRGILK